jgi:Glycosyl hydrolase family 79 C-terminal beta domain
MTFIGVNIHGGEGCTYSPIQWNVTVHGRRMADEGLIRAFRATPVYYAMLAFAEILGTAADSSVVINMFHFNENGTVFYSSSGTKENDTVGYTVQHDGGASYSVVLINKKPCYDDKRLKCSHVNAHITIPEMATNCTVQIKELIAAKITSKYNSVTWNGQTTYQTPEGTLLGNTTEIVMNVNPSEGFEVEVKDTSAIVVTIKASASPEQPAQPEQPYQPA